MIEAKKIAKVYGKGDIAVKALNNISLNIREGEFLAIMGPSGSGKSTLMNILGCLDTPSSGQYILGGTDVSKMNDKQLAHIRNRKIGFIFQTFNLLPGLSAIKNVEQPMLYSGIRKRERFKIAREALESVGLGNRIDHKPSELSGGQRQRVAIARSFVNDPAILLADEPTGNLDTNSEDEILSILTGLNNKGITIIMVTHDRRVAGYAHRIINFRDGIITGEEMTGNKFSPCSTVSGGGKGETG